MAVESISLGSIVAALLLPTLFPKGAFLPPFSPQSSATGGRPRTPRIPKECYSTTPDMAEKGNLDFESYFVDTNICEDILLQLCE